MSKAIPRTIHYVGSPPEASGGTDERRSLPAARVLLIVPDAEGGTFLYRYGEAGAFSGDTLHASVEEAREQAVFEFGEAVGEWCEVPPESEDPVEFAIALAARPRE